MKQSNTEINLLNKFPEIKQNVLLAPFTSFKIGGPAKYFYQVKNNEEARNVIQFCNNYNFPFFILGNGSNILISDHGFDGLVVKMENNKIIINTDATVYAESGVQLQKFISELKKNNLTGMEFLVGIPGTIGGAICGNVGTPTKWIDQCILNVDYINISNQVIKIPKSNCKFAYRVSRFKNNDKEIILGAEFSLKKTNTNEINKLIKNYLNKRTHQPVNQPCAGSIFKNPPGNKAWQLIDNLGLRGKKIGNAQVSIEHANFIINIGNAKAEDVVILISYIKQQVRDKLRIQLNEEIKYIGF